jgi:ribose transport system substrate-binding protein
VQFVAFDSDPLVVRGLTEDKVHGVVLQNPVKMGYLAVQSIANHIAGKPVEKRVSTGEELATKANMSTPEMQALLNPKQAN